MERESGSFGQMENLLPVVNTREINRVCQMLEKAEVKTCDLIFRGSNHVFLAGLNNEGTEMKAVYKPRRGEAPLWDFPDGTLYRREYASFVTSQALGWLLIPPTVIREGPYGAGTMQWFVEHGNRTGYESRIGSDLFRLKQVAVFDYVVNNADRKSGHFIEDRDGRMWVLDHGLTFNTVPKLRTVLWDFAGQTVPEPIIADMEKLLQKVAAEGLLRQILHRLLEDMEVRALEQRLRSVIENPVFPQPASHRSIPWPWY